MELLITGYLLIGFLLGFINIYFDIWVDGPVNFQSSYSMPFVMFVSLWPLVLSFFIIKKVFESLFHFVIYLKNPDKDKDIHL